jgi:hypothetical protein
MSAPGTSREIVAIYAHPGTETRRRGAAGELTAA